MCYADGNAVRIVLSILFYKKTPIRLQKLTFCFIIALTVWWRKIQ